MVRPRLVRAEVLEARKLLERKLPHDWLVQTMPRDVLTHVVSLLPATSDIAHMDQLCHAFHDCDDDGCPPIVEDALRMRAAARGHAGPPPDRTGRAETGRLLREEFMHFLEQTLRTEHEGCILSLSCDTNTGCARSRMDRTPPAHAQSTSGS